jgi:hypothetical protein
MADERKINSASGDILTKIISFALKKSAEKCCARFMVRGVSRGSTSASSADASDHKPYSPLQNDSFWPCDTNNYCSAKSLMLRIATFNGSNGNRFIEGNEVSCWIKITKK